MLQIFRHYLIISRPLNVLISMLTVLVAAVIARGDYYTPVLLFASLTAGFVTSGANIVNDIYDIQIDRINKPNRLLASGAVSTRFAWIAFGFSYSAGILIAFYSGSALFVLALLFAVLLYWYSARLKRVVFWGNFVVSLSTAIAFVYGALAVGRWTAGIVPAVFAFCFHLGREIIKDMQDVEGDQALNAQTIPIVYGLKKSAVMVIIIFILLIILTIIPYILGIYGVAYLYLVLGGVDTVLIIVCIVVWRHREPAVLGKISHLLKLDMFIGLLAIMLG